MNELIEYNSSMCITVTATIANVQESLQGLSLSCTDAVTVFSVIVIDVVGKLHFVTKTMLSF